MSEEWNYTIDVVIHNQHKAIECAAVICELEDKADHKQLAELIRGLKQVSIYPNTQPPVHDIKLPETWRFCEGDLIAYQSDAFEKAAQICELEPDAHHFNLAEMIRSLKQDNRLI